MPELPTGTVTFLFTDLEGSTRLWEEFPDAMQPALARHDEILRGEVTSNGGHIVKTTGDGVHAVFATAHDALDAAVAAQRALDAAEWAATGPLRVRMGLHTCEAELRDGDYYGSAVNRAARLMSAAHGGQIVVSQATEGIARDGLGDEVELADLGEHNLRDLSRAERVFQVRAPGLADDFPTLRSLDAFPGNLPLQLTSFVGRDRELNSIGKALDEWRLVTLTGVGGVGKTRLSVQAAAEILPRFPDGAWFCELVVASDADAMAQVIASTLGANSRQGMTLEASTVEFLRGKQILIILDNCEHLLAPAARLAEDILRSCPAVRLLATSREGLGVDGEHMMSLRSLGTPDTGGADVDIQSSDAVQLFVERAIAAEADFVLDSASTDSVAEICRRLDGIPLAIELAAARVVVMSPRDIAARLDERFRLLTGGRRTAVERHQTLRATVDWSYSMLASREQTIFDRLGVFAGSFDARAAEAITSDDDIEAWDVMDALTDLAAKSMVVVERESGATGYQLLETMRAYARERLDGTDDADEWRRRHARHYADAAEEAGIGFLAPDELVWRARVRNELDNLRAAVAWSLDRTDPLDNELGIRIIAALAQLAMEDRPSGIGEWAERATPIAETSEARYRTAVLGAAAENLRNRGEISASHALALDAVRDGVPRDCQASHIGFITLSVDEAILGSAAQAFQYVNEGVDALEAAGNPEGRCILQGVAAMWAADFDTPLATTYATEALAYARGSGNPTLLASTLFTYAWVVHTGDSVTALASLEESMILARQGLSTSVLIPGLCMIATLRARAGDTLGSLAHLREGMLAARHNGDLPMVVGPAEDGIAVFSECGELEVAAVLVGVATVGVLARFAVASHARSFGRDDDIARVRASLGEAEFEALSDRGAAMSVDEVMDFVLVETERVLSERADGIDGID